MPKTKEQENEEQFIFHVLKIKIGVDVKSCDDCAADQAGEMAARGLQVESRSSSTGRNSS